MSREIVGLKRLVGEVGWSEESDIDDESARVQRLSVQSRLLEVPRFGG